MFSQIPVQIKHLMYLRMSHKCCVMALVSGESSDFTIEVFLSSSVDLDSQFTEVLENVVGFLYTIWSFLSWCFTMITELFCSLVHGQSNFSINYTGIVKENLE